MSDKAKEVLIAVKVPPNETIWKVLLACTSDPMPELEAEWRILPDDAEPVGWFDQLDGLKLSDDNYRLIDAPQEAGPSEAEIDRHLDAVLKASGSALRNYSMHKTKENMRAAMREAIMQGQQLSPTHDERREDETAWLIEEWDHSIAHRWLRLYQDSGHGAKVNMCWSYDANFAIRFAREEDAHIFASLHRDFIGVPKITEHRFIKAPQSPTSGERK